LLFHETLKQQSKLTHIVAPNRPPKNKTKRPAVPARKGESMARVEDLADAADENTILIMAILGSTFTCQYYDVEKLDALVGEKNKQHPDWHLGIHVDAASGGFLAPFALPDLRWDFRLDNVVSIQASAHKHGQCLAGIGWVLFRSPAFLPRSLVFADAYLGGQQLTATLNFSKGATGLVNSIYMFMRLGRAGYKALAEHMYRNAGMLRGEFFSSFCDQRALYKPSNKTKTTRHHLFRILMLILRFADKRAAFLVAAVAAATAATAPRKKEKPPRKKNKKAK
jgi:hypothetical protein